MFPAPGSQPLDVLLASEDRALLRHLSRFLHTLGYGVGQVADLGRVPPLLEHDTVDLLIVDAGEDLQRALATCRQATAQRHRFVHTVLMSAGDLPLDVPAAVSAGVDDFLAKPVVYGELLMRLREGARALAFERRVRKQAPTDRATGLPGEILLVQRLERKTPGGGGSHASTVCVVFDIDFFRCVNHRHGHPAGDAALRSVAEVLRAACDDEALVVCLAEGRFAVLREDSEEEQAADWAERVRQQVARTEIAVGESSLQLTLSAGLAAVDPTEPEPRRAVDRACEALRLAKRSGRDCVVRFGQFDRDTKAWEELAAPGKLFEGTVAADVMTPFPIVLREDDSIALARRLFERTGLPVLAVTAADGKLIGLLHAENVTATSVQEMTVGRVVDTSVKVFDERATFASLVSYFAEDSASAAVVACGEDPAGMITRDGLAALSQPIDKALLCPGPPAVGSEYLLVSD